MTKTQKGVLSLLLAIFIFCLTNVAVKDSIGLYPVIQVVFFRLFFAILPVSFWVQYSGGWRTLATKKLPWHGLCGLLGVLLLFCLFSSFRHLPMADATALSYSSVLFLSLLSGPFLKEYVTKDRWLGIFIGFLGVLMVAKPSGQISIGIYYSLAFAISDSILMLCIRHLSQYDRGSTIAFWFLIFASALSLIILPWFWVTPTLESTLKLILLGLGAGVGQIFMTRAYSLASATVLGPMLYSAMIWGVVFGVLFFHEVPSISLLIGIALIIASGLYVIFLEKKCQTSS